MFWTISILFLAGIIWGVCVYLTQKLSFIYKKPHLVGVISVIRLAALGKFFYIMLKSHEIHPIILVASFLVAYWLTILLFKELIHART